jgi:hypothetical protein
LGKNSCTENRGEVQFLRVLRQDTLRSLIWEVVHSTIASAAKKRFLFFAPYLPFQRYLGCYQEAFEVGVVLGYAFRNRLAVFAKLFSEPGHEQEVVTFMQELGERRLREVGEARGFFDLATLAEEHRIKANWQESGITEAEIGRLEKYHKMSAKKASGNLYVAVNTGIGFGSAFPELTEKLWKVRHERAIDRDEWAKWRKMGYGDEPPEPVPLAKRQEDLLTLVELFVSKACPELLPQFRIQS